MPNDKEGIQIYAKEIENNGKIISDSTAKIVTEKYSGTGSVETKKDNRKKSEWKTPAVIVSVIACVIAVIAIIVAHEDAQTNFSDDKNAPPAFSQTMINSPGSSQNQFNAPIYGSVNIGQPPESKVTNFEVKEKNTPVDNKDYKFKNVYLVHISPPIGTTTKIKIIPDDFYTASIGRSEHVVTTLETTVDETRVPVTVYTTTPVAENHFSFQLIK